MTLSLSRKALMLVSIPLAFEVVFVASLATLLHQVDYERAREAHAREVAMHFNNMLRILLDRGSSLVFSYLANSEVFHKRFLEGQKQTDREEAELFELVRNDSYEKQATEKLMKLNKVVRDNLANAAISMREGNLQEAKEQWTKVQSAMEELRANYDEVVKRHEDIQQERKKAQFQYRRELELVLYAGVGFNILLAVCLAIYFNRGTSQRLQVLIDNTKRLAAGQILMPKLDGDDEIAYLDKTFREMSESLATAMQKERAVVENAAEMICTINSQNRITTVNPACESILGRKPGDILGTNINDLIFSEDRQHTMQELSRVAKERSKTVLETRLLKNDATTADVSFSAQWSESDKNIICVLHDVTLRKNIDRLKQDFVAMVSHDLRTPLTSIHMVLDLLQAEAYGPLSKGGHERIAEAESNVERLIALVNELLTLDKMESGMLELAESDVSVDVIIKSAIEMVTGVTEKNEITIDVHPHSADTLHVDEERITQVLSNLLSNAVKFSPRGEKVTIAVNKIPGFLEFSIVDQGRGVPVNLHEAIFQRFKQVERSDERKKGGTGLGLAICKAIVERHGGTIGVESEPGKGSKFWFRIPHVDAHGNLGTESSGDA
ncbi:MAG TPA: ATP-binding protein [Oculatellaceae cyanobacterium]